MRVAFYTLGCKVNQYETQIMEQMFSAEGFDIVDSASGSADIYVVNSCTVTATGDKKSRQVLRRFKRQNPGAAAVLTGCYPQAFPEAAQQIPEADVITGTYRRSAVLEAVKEYLSTGKRVVRITPMERKGENRARFEEMRAGQMNERTRAFVKIQDGCDRFCSYCIIPTARGPVRSKPLEEIRAELTALAENGYREAVLVGINLPCYGSDLGLGLLDAVKTACAIPGLERVRLGSLEPELLTPEDIAAMAAMPNLCPQFHLSLQSGCDATLKRMNRRYDTAEYRRIVRDLRSAFENASITTDIMVGFPGEDEGEFRESLAFAEEIAFAKAHVFMYSPRPGTRAANMPGQVDSAAKERRSGEMIRATERTRRKFLESQIGRREQVLFETNTSGGLYHGYTRNYTPVEAASLENLCGQMREVTITGLTEDGQGCFGAAE
ncbi:MAG: tRNA (N(6)-L-threonylcarbamoyladenosine(37)-C(2))-methylthiotransferase MtaB [Oscillospiraceae bacterium]|nr:tRNA (N(6)-L-threonylcarbamoyladenosine(37)-C(2))-methylthiotransferase MtaB [Oscillospiraceae bacterium]